MLPATVAPFLGLAIPLALLVYALDAGAQPPVTLRPPNATLAEEFSDLTSVREFPDGRALLTDRIENRIVMADFSTRRVTTVGRVGDGPREYRNALPLFRLGGDSSLMPGFPNARWTLLVGDSIVGTIPAHHPLVAAVPLLYGADGRGLLLTTADPTGQRAAGRGRQDDSTYLLLLARATMRADTIGRLGVAPAGVTGQNPGSRGGSRPFYAVYDKAVLSNDGWVAVCRGSPYRVEWRSPDGSWTRGPAPLDQPIQMNEREKKAYLERRSAAAAPRGGNRTPSAPPRAAPIINEWPATIPPVSGSWPLRATEDGHVVIRRTATAGHDGAVYDVVNRGGIRVRQVALPANARILGFGANSVYVSRWDDDGIQTVSRHPWP